MLSPNATKRVRDSSGAGAATVTLNEHEAVAEEFVAVQLTVVLPTRNIVPEPGVHVVTTPAPPMFPEVVGVGGG
jgi:hypothetical protein